MLIPRFSLRWLLALTTVSSVFFYVMTLAVRGSQWAIALTAAISGFLLTMLVYAMLFGVAWMLAEFMRLFRPRRVQPSSPFAASQPPPQYVPPEAPE